MAEAALRNFTLNFGPQHPVCAENSDSDVLVMQRADQRMRHNASNPLNRARDWRILVQ